MNNVLIAYYSRKGNNYSGGKIKNLTIGNTEVIARKIQALTGGHLFEIRTVRSYPDDYTETTEISKIEQKKNARPELTKLPENMDRYNTIYLGYPNWWGTMPMAVFTFLEAFELRGKTIVPFCTHEGSGMGKSEKDIRSMCPGANVVKGIAIYGSSVQKADEELKCWMQNLKLIKQ